MKKSLLHALTLLSQQEYRFQRTDTSDIPNNRAKIYNDNRNKTVLTDKELLKEISKVIKTENGYLQYDTAIRKIRELLQDNGY